MGHPLRLGALAVLATGVFATSAANAAAPPTITATWVATVSTTSANLRAEVNPQGQSTTYRFEYTTETSFQANGFTGASKVPLGSEPSIGAGSAPVAVVQHVGGLKTAGTYRYRVVATNGSGSALGPIRMLMTDELAPAFSLPDNRGWEMVSPVDKNGGEIQGFGGNFGGGALQVAAAGGSVTYSSASSFGGAQGAPGASQYISRRGAGGWSTQNITLPAESGAYGDHPDGVPYQIFSTDLSVALVLNGRRCLAGDPCPRSYSLRDNALGDVSALPFEEPGLAFAGASPNLGLIALATGSSLLLVNPSSGETTDIPGAALAAPGGSISADGSRVYWTDGAGLFLRDGDGMLQVDAGVGGGGAFQAASADGSIAFFTKSGHLYRYAVASETATDLTPGGEVQGVLGASDDGNYAYYLTPAGLFLWHAGTTTPVAPAADAGNYPPSTGSARVSSDGRRLAFLSSGELTAYDNAGEPEAYLYEAPAGDEGGGTLLCASCNPSGERPLGPASLPGASPNGSGPRAYRPRALTAAGNRLFFDSFDALVPQDTNADRDVYQWEAPGSGDCAKAGGCLRLISSGRAEGGASFVDASADGADAFFLTDGSLVPSDPGSVDLYDARVGGGFPLPPAPTPCFGDACQPLLPEPEDPTPGTLRGSAEGNPPAVLGKPCKKGQTRRKGKCAKKKGRHRKAHGGRR